MVGRISEIGSDQNRFVKIDGMCPKTFRSSPVCMIVWWLVTIIVTPLAWLNLKHCREDNPLIVGYKHGNYLKHCRIIKRIGSAQLSNNLFSKLCKAKTWKLFWSFEIKNFHSSTIRLRGGLDIGKCLIVCQWISQSVSHAF